MENISSNIRREKFFVWHELNVTIHLKIILNILIWLFKKKNRLENKVTPSPDIFKIKLFQNYSLLYYFLIVFNFLETRMDKDDK